MDEPVTRTSAVPPADSPLARRSEDGRFVPGSVIGGRFRIVALIGRGGMGQVYRADDLKLGQPVALKFLPDALERDAAALARFHNEVRLARQVSHPSVCRVFDIGEVNGHHFLSMEYIDGEDLSSLMRRIGRLPHDKALEVARQLCAGLAAAHDAGLLHRDLKPANIMLDGRGRARITDFGLAGYDADIAGHDIGSGTPAYMAPEQLAGREVTRRSDIYALGLVLSEIFTGRRVFDAASLPELLRLRSHGTPARPSHWIADIDPLVERVILRCLEPDPRERPETALQVAASLPGGNPIEAALLAGETPSPEMVAASPTVGVLRPAVALTCLVGVIVALIVLSIGDRVHLHHLAPLRTSPVILADRAARLVAQLGYNDPPADRASGFALDDSWIQWTGDPLPGAARWSRIASGLPLTYYFWFRQSPAPMLPTAGGTPAVVVTQSDPAPTVPGMVHVVMDPTGRLVSFTAVPAAEVSSTPTSPVDWAPLFDAAGLKMSSFASAPPRWTPATFADDARAWVGRFPDHADLTLRVEAASVHGRPVRFQLIGDWETPTSRKDAVGATGDFAGVLLITVMLGAILIGGIVMARANLRAGRGDLMGARKMALLVGVTTLLAVVIGSEFPATFSGVMQMLVTVLHESLLSAAIAWLLYVALEPVIRSTRPALLVSWNRLLSGRWRDPMVGRDVLLGGLLALVGACGFMLSGWIKVWIQHPIGPNYALDLMGFGTIRGSIELVLLALNPTIVLAALVFIALVSRVVKHAWLGDALLAVICVVGFVLFTARSWPAILGTVIWIPLAVVAVARFGLVAGVSWLVFFNLGMRSSLTTDLSAWDVDSVAFRVVLMLALAGFGGVIAIGPRRPHPEATR